MLPRQCHHDTLALPWQRAVCSLPPLKSVAQNLNLTGASSFFLLLPGNLPSWFCCGNLLLPLQVTPFLAMSRWSSVPFVSQCVVPNSWQPVLNVSIAKTGPVKRNKVYWEVGGGKYWLLPGLQKASRTSNMSSLWAYP